VILFRGGVRLDRVLVFNPPVKAVGLDLLFQEFDVSSHAVGGSRFGTASAAVRAAGCPAHRWP
jgi:hypothetical protein